MDYRESLDFLYALQRFGIKLGLENIRALLERLGHPERAFASVHVAGTNGKGSVCACLAGILTRSGIRTGLYTSPHLHSFTERIRVDGLSIGEAEVGALTSEIRAAAPDVPATFFEFTTALALLHFRKQGAQTAVLETGMGGRLDATNAVTPRVAVITPVCLDHSEHLGESLAAIAAEKGGIIKPGVPVVIGRQAPEALDVLLAIARERRAPVHLAGEDFSGDSDGAGFSFRGLGLDLPGLRPALPGRHQHGNLSLALAAAALLRRQGTDIPEAALYAGVAGARWPGRLEWWKGGREILLDGAHNEGGARVLADYLSGLAIDGIHWVAGMKGDKRPEDILSPLLPRVRALYAVAPPVEAPLPPEQLAGLAAASGVKAEAYADAGEALDAALAARRPGEIVLVAGSLFLVAAAREHLLRAEGKAA